jgi:hypothetical protein
MKVREHLQPIKPSSEEVNATSLFGRLVVSQRGSSVVREVAGYLCCRKQVEALDRLTHVAAEADGSL